ncbi:MAG: hypothetical protein AAGH15_09385 [Myxococcota bacterium]
MALRTRPAALLAALLPALAGGCASAPPCGPASCGFGVCDLDGTCRELGVRRDARFAASARVRAEPGPGSADTMELGGAEGRRVRLSFPLPDEGEVVEAVLVMHPAPLARATAPRRVRVGGPGPRVERVVQLIEDRPFRVDVTEHARALGPGARLELAVSARGGDDAPWRLTSPRGLELTHRPVLELRLRAADGAEDGAEDDARAADGEDAAPSGDD